MKKKYYKKPYRIKRKRSIFKNRFFWLCILILIIAGSIFYFLFLYPFFDVKEIIISGNEEVKGDELRSSSPFTNARVVDELRSSSPFTNARVKEEIENLVKEQIQTDFKFFKNKNINLINLKEIDKIILENFHQIARVSSKKELPDAIIIEIEERKPAAVFKQNNNWFFADKEGIIFQQINDEVATQTAEQITIIQNSLLTKDLKLGERIAEKEIISQIIEFDSKLKEDLKISLPEPQRRVEKRIYSLGLEELTIISEERLNAKTSEGWEIYFNLKGDLNWQILKLKAVLENRIPPEKRGNIDYIDLRFERVYIFPENYNQ